MISKSKNLTILGIIVSTLALLALLVLSDVSPLGKHSLIAAVIIGFLGPLVVSWINSKQVLESTSTLPPDSPKEPNIGITTTGDFKNEGSLNMARDIYGNTKLSMM